uniref:Uncharacterized protein n=1 Tax=Rhizophora mucronata TaxID=61149 RepID=A0A2P2PCK1_RHIMU
MLYLSLRDSVIAEIEDDSMECYCFAYEEERNTRYHAYYWDQFPYKAHIECMVSEVCILLPFL